MPYATGSAGLAITVRGSSRRIKIMRFRPANIRLINRRLNCPDCCWLCPRKTANKTTATNPQIAQVDTVTPYQGNALIEPIGLTTLRQVAENVRTLSELLRGIRHAR